MSAGVNLNGLSTLFKKSEEITVIQKHYSLDLLNFLHLRLIPLPYYLLPLPYDSLQPADFRVESDLASHLSRSTPCPFHIHLLRLLVIGISLYFL